ncbi:hypothetical protein ACF8MD_43300 [Pseudomonas sp. zjy_8]
MNHWFTEACSALIRTKNTHQVALFLPEDLRGGVTEQVRALRDGLQARHEMAPSWRDIELRAPDWPGGMMPANAYTTPEAPCHSLN